MRPYFCDDQVTIYHGDCRDILPSLPTVDLVFTSPPYNCGMDYETASDALPVEEYFSALRQSFVLSSARLDAGCYSVVNVPSWIGSRQEQIFAFDRYREICGASLRFEDVIIWQKGPPNGTAWGNFRTSPRIRANHEWILVHRSAGKRAGESDIAWDEWSRLTQSVWTIPATLPYRDEHPATFPDELPRRVIALYSPAGGTVLDPYCGTGTTLNEARKAGRKAIGIEINERFCEVAARRLSQGLLFG